MLTHHTPLLRKFLSLPMTRMGWLSVGLTATSLVLLILGYLVFEVLAVEELWEGMIGIQAITRCFCVGWLAQL